MRFFEFNQTLEEGGKSDKKRYNSEVGLIYGFVTGGADPANFDPSNPQATIGQNSVENPEQFYSEVKKLLAPNFDPQRFAFWVNRAAAIKQSIESKMETFPTKFGWAGGKNQADNAADIKFVDSNIAGISVKDAGITLGNLTPASLGIEQERGVDVFSKYSKSYFNNLKKQVFTDLLATAKSDKSGQPLSYHRKEPGKYTIQYVPEKDIFVIGYKGKQIERTEQNIMAGIEKNAPWQRVFGDWFVANWATKKGYAQPLYKDLASQFTLIINNHLQQSNQLKRILQFSNVPYFYATEQNLYYVPSADEAGELVLRKVSAGEPDGVSQYFYAEMGRPDSEQNAKVQIYLRSANGLFASNTTVRVQNLIDPQYISWEKLS